MKGHVQTYFVVVLIICVGLYSRSWAHSEHSYYDEIKRAVFGDKYESLPDYKVTRKMFDDGNRNLLLNEAKRSLSSDADLTEFSAGQKLLQANGTCFAGRWEINSDSPYSGLFKAQTSLPMLARVSVSLSGTQQKDKRAVGMAIKLFHEPNARTQSETSNVFVMHSLGGIKTQYTLDLAMDNEPELGSLPPFRDLLTAKRLENDLLKADKIFSGKNANARFRPVSHLAKIQADGSEVETPRMPYWLNIAPLNNMPRINKNDFREELNTALYPQHQIVWQISVSDFDENGKSSAQWKAIGTLIATESVVSKSCDTRLHFQHPTIQEKNQ